MKHPSQYLTRVDYWSLHPDKCLNDYRTKDDKPTQNEGFKSKEEEQEYYDLLLTAEEQIY